MARAGKATRRSRVGRIEYSYEHGYFCTVHGRTAVYSGREIDAHWRCSMNPRCRPLMGKP